MLTDERLAEIRARTEAAHPGPWHTSNGVSCTHVVSEDDQFHTGCILFSGRSRTAEFIAAARTDVPDLLAALDSERAAHRDTLACSKALERAYQRITRPDETYGHAARRILRTLGLEVTPERETFVTKELVVIAEAARKDTLP